MDEHRTKVGIGVLIFKDGKVLLGKRLSKHATGVYAGPGGHLEYMESFAQCAKRETLEETGIEIENLRFICVTNLKEYAPKHYVDIGILADWKSGEPQLLEPDKCAGWDWYDLNALPQPLFSTVENYLKALESGATYFDAS
ncbi:MAG: NUDIX domain-containing protein [Patescibacteria group bacterium]